MKLLILAQTPPPIHGQSMMVGLLKDGLIRRGWPVKHSNLRLSAAGSEIGRWRVAKIWRLVQAIGTAIAARFRHGCDTLYYVPAPGKRGALYRDWLVMLVCRPLFRRIILHWHAAGLGAWISTQATTFERGVSRRLLGGADLAIVLGERLRADAAVFAPRRILVVRNGLPDPCPNFVRMPPTPGAPFRAVFLGLCTRQKGLFDALEGVIAANKSAGSKEPVFHLTVAGEFPDPKERAEFEAAAGQPHIPVRWIGFVGGDAKHALLAEADILLFPTSYAHETQGLVVVEALAFDLPAIVTAWRAVDENLPAQGIHRVSAGRPDQISAALLDARQKRPPPLLLRRHYLAHYTADAHLDAMVAALSTLAEPGTVASARLSRDKGESATRVE